MRHSARMPDDAAEPLRSIHVVAGVITDPRGRILLTRRDGSSDMAGLWEFPGGKREPGETPEEALIRELREEIGIEVTAVGEKIIEVPQRYPDKRLRLDVRHVTRWKGTPRGCEGQALMWVLPERLERYSMPPADVPVVAALRQPDRYLVTPEPDEDDEAWLAALKRAIAAGTRRVQLRSRLLHGSLRWRELAVRATALCLERDVEVLLNRDIARAAELGVGVHLGSEQLAALTERPLPAGLAVGASCHDAEDLRHARRLGCDFAVIGPVLATATHPGATPLGWDGFVGLREDTALPLYAIGGLGRDDVSAARGQGAQGIAAIRGLWAVPRTMAGH